MKPLVKSQITNFTHVIPDIKHAYLLPSLRILATTSLPYVIPIPFSNQNLIKKITTKEIAS